MGPRGHASEKEEATQQLLNSSYHTATKVAPRAL